MSGASGSWDDGPTGQRRDVARTGPPAERSTAGAITALVGLAALGVVIVSLPDIQRYLSMRAIARDKPPTR